MFHKTPLKNLLSVSNLYTLHYDIFSSHFYFEGERHDFWEFMYVDNGETEIRLGDETVRLKQNDGLFIAPNTHHDLRTFEQFTTAFVITFECNSSLLNVLSNKIVQLPKSEANLLSLLLSEGEQTFELPMFEKLLYKPNAPLGGAQIVKNLFEQFLILNIRKFSTSSHANEFNQRNGLENVICDSILKILDENIYGTITIEEIAKRLGYCKSYISKVFKEVCKCSINQLFINKKIEKAKGLIKYNQADFTEISSILGFDNPHYFSRCFKRVTGVTPSEYKKSIASSLFSPPPPPTQMKKNK